jgi:oligopeptide/dipeptide ABC transporter ATP-binding protein
MYAGQIIEQGEVGTVLREPRHPYTMGLLASLPGIGAPQRYLHPIAGAPPSLLAPPSGCRFHPRCPYAVEHCRSWIPELLAVGPQHTAACWRQDAIRAEADATGIALRETA